MTTPQLMTKDSGALSNTKSKRRKVLHLSKRMVSWSMTPSEKANILNTQFQSVFSARNPLSLKALCTRATNFIKLDGTPNETPQMPPINKTKEGVWRRLKGLNPHKAAGPDNLKPIVLKELAGIIAPVVTRLYRASLKQAKTLDAWKEAHVTPVFKKGEKYKAINYHPCVSDLHPLQTDGTHPVQPYHGTPKHKSSAI